MAAMESLEEVMKRGSTKVYRPGENLPTDDDMAARRSAEEAAQRLRVFAQQVAYVERLRGALLRGERPARPGTDGATGAPGELLLEAAAQFKSEANAHFTAKRSNVALKGYLTAAWLLRLDAASPFPPSLTPAAAEDEPRGEEAIALLGDGEADDGVAETPFADVDCGRRAGELRIALHANAAAALLALEDFSAARAACEYVLGLEAGHQKAQFRLAKAHEGLEHFGKAEMILNGLAQASAPGAREALAAVRRKRSQRQKTQKAMAGFFDAGGTYSDAELEARRRETRAAERLRNVKAAAAKDAAVLAAPKSPAGPVGTAGASPVALLSAPDAGDAARTDAELGQEQLSKVSAADRDLLLQLHADGAPRAALTEAYAAARQREIARVSACMTQDERDAFARVAVDDTLGQAEIDARFEAYRCEVAIREMLTSAPLCLFLRPRCVSMSCPVHHRAIAVAAPETIAAVIEPPASLIRCKGSRIAVGHVLRRTARSRFRVQRRRQVARARASARAEFDAAA